MALSKEVIPRTHVTDNSWVQSCESKIKRILSIADRFQIRTRTRNISANRTFGCVRGESSSGGRLLGEEAKQPFMLRRTKEH